MRIFVLLAAAASLAACSTNRVADAFDTRQNAGACPPAGSIYNAARIVEFKPGGTNFTDIQYSGEIVDVRMFCRYAGGDPVRAEIEIDFAFGRGPDGAADTREFSYWVAVTRRSGKVLNKEWFTTKADFGAGKVTGTSEVIQNIVIPRADETISAANFEILVGFELTEEQAAFNKEGRRFLLGAGQ